MPKINYSQKVKEFIANRIVETQNENVDFNELHNEFIEKEIEEAKKEGKQDMKNKALIATQEILESYSDDTVGNEIYDSISQL